MSPDQGGAGNEAEVQDGSNHAVNMTVNSRQFKNTPGLIAFGLTGLIQMPIIAMFA